MYQTYYMSKNSLEILLNLKKKWLKGLINFHDFHQNKTEKFSFLLTCHWPGDKSACSHIQRTAGSWHPGRTVSSARFLKAS